MASYASTFSSIKTAVAEKLRMADTGDDARIGTWVNQALCRVAVDTHWFMGSVDGAALAAGASSQALPTTLVELEQISLVFGGQPYYLFPTEFDQILMLRSRGPSSGPPRYYCLRKNTVELWPSAAGGEVLSYYGAILPDPLLTAPTDVPGLPEPYAAKLLEYGACLEAADFKKDVYLFFHYTPKYQEWLSGFQAFCNRRITRASMQVPVYGPDGRPFDVAYVPHDRSSDWYTTGWRY